MDEVKFNYVQEYQILGYLLYPMGRISDQLTDLLDKEANYPEIVLYSKSVLTAFSLYRLLPEGNTPQKNKPADLCSIVSLGRNLLEIYNHFFYLCFDKVSDSEADFRRLVFLYHYLNEHQRVGQKIGVGAMELDLNRKNVLEEYRRRVERHPFLKHLDNKMRKQIILGKRAVYEGRIKITRKYSKNFEFLEGFYKIMSNHVHSDMYGLLLSFDGKTYGCDNERNREKIAGVLYLVNYYVGLIVRSIVEVFPQSTKYIPTKAATLVEKLTIRF